MARLPHLPESELDLMLTIWSMEGPVTAPALLEKLEKPLTASALHSYLKRLEEKGYLCCEKVGKVNQYRPLVDRAASQRQESRSILGKLYQGSLRHFTAALYDGGNLDRREVEELRAYLEELEERGEV